MKNNKLPSGAQSVINRFESQIPAVVGISNTTVKTLLTIFAKEKKLKVEERFIDEVAADMQPQELRRRILVQADYITKYACSLDDIKQIKHMPGAGLDGTRLPNDIRGLFIAVLQRALLAEKKLKKLSENR